VVRRLLNQYNAIQPPENEFFPACVMFADISGFTVSARLLTHSALSYSFCTDNIPHFFPFLSSSVV
jgi:hypothetical protein